MIVTTGKIVVVEAGFEESFRFERDSRTPGLVTVEKTKYNHDGPKEFTLPGNKNDALNFVAGYMRVIHADVGYSKNECESESDCTNPELESLLVKFRQLPPKQQEVLLNYAMEAWPVSGDLPVSCPKHKK